MHPIAISRMKKSKFYYIIAVAAILWIESDRYQVQNNILAKYRFRFSSQKYINNKFRFRFWLHIRPVRIRNIDQTIRTWTTISTDTVCQIEITQVEPNTTDKNYSYPFLHRQEIHETHVAPASQHIAPAIAYLFLFFMYILSLIQSQLVK